MHKGVNTVQAMRQNGNSGNIIGKCGTMRMNINAVSKAAHYQNIGKKYRQIVYEVRTKLFAVLRCTTRTYHIDDM